MRDRPLLCTTFGFSRHRPRLIARALRDWPVVRLPIRLAERVHRRRQRRRRALLLTRPRARNERNGIFLSSARFTFSRLARFHRRSLCLLTCPRDISCRECESAEYQCRRDARRRAHIVPALTSLLFQETAKSSKDKAKNGKDVDAVDEVRLYYLSLCLCHYSPGYIATPVIADRQRLRAQCVHCFALAQYSKI